MSLYIDTNVVHAEIDRKYELAGVDPRDHHDTDGTRHGRPLLPLAAHPLAAFVARLVGGSANPGGRSRRAAGQVDTGRPRHL